MQGHPWSLGDGELNLGTPWQYYLEIPQRRYWHSGFLWSAFCVCINGLRLGSDYGLQVKTFFLLALVKLPGTRSLFQEKSSSRLEYTAEMNRGHHSVYSEQLPSEVPWWIYSALVFGTPWRSYLIPLWIHLAQLSLAPSSKKRWLTAGGIGHLLKIFKYLCEDIQLA